MRQPCPQSETGLASGAVAPGGWNFCQPPAAPMRLKGQLQRHGEASFALDGDLLDYPAAVSSKVVRRIMNGQSSQVVQRDSCQTREGSLDQRSAFLAASTNIARPCHHVGPAAHKLSHSTNDVRLIGAVRHHYNDHITLASLET